MLPDRLIIMKATTPTILLAGMFATLALASGCSDSPRNDAAGGGGAAGTASGGRGGGGGTDAPGGTGGGYAGTGGGGTGGAGPAGASGTTGGAEGGGSGAGGVAGGGGSAGQGGSVGGSAGGSAGSSGGAGTTGAAGSAGGGGSAGAGGSAPLLAPPAPVGIAVLNSNYTSTSLSLLAPAGGLNRADCVHTTTSGTGSTTISGDVGLPSQPQRGGKIVLIDRGNTALTFVNPGSCTFDHQISVKGGFNFSNPHDVVILRDDKAYVTRYEKNLAPTADPTTSGDDVLIVDPRDGTVTGHVALSSYAPQVTGKTIQARPNRAVIAAGKVVVSLNNMSGDFSTYTEGRLAVIDPDTDAVLQTVALTGLKNCEAMEYLPAIKLLLVTCGGAFGAQDQALESGLALVDMSGSTATLSRVISAVAFNARPLSFQGITGTTQGGRRRAFASTMGAFPSGGKPAVPDQLFVVDLDSGVTSPLASSGAFNLGIASVTIGGGQLLVPDGATGTPRVHVLDLTGTGAPVETSTFVTDSVNNFPPRQIAWY